MIGIYKITNRVNGKVYIGQSWNIERRWKQHTIQLKRIYKSHNIHLYSAMKKYGIENFSFEILMLFMNSPFTQGYLDRFEDMYINRFESINPEMGYNKKSGGSSGKMSDEAKAKISKANRGRKLSLEQRIKLSEAHKGQKPSVKTIEAVRKASTGRVKSKSEREKLSKARKGKNYRDKTVICVETNIIYPSIKKAEEINNYSKGSICKCLKGVQKTAFGFHWKYFDE